MAQNVIQHPMEPLGSVNITSLSSAVGLSSIPSGATMVRLSAVTQNVRITFDGTTPTASVGNRILATGEDLEISLTDLTKIQVIEETASASLYVSYFRPKTTG